jgi:alpha-galactosidase
LADGGRAVILLNRGAATASISADWADIGYPATVKATVRDLWAKKDMGKFAANYTAQVPSHGVVMVRVTP